MKRALLLVEKTAMPTADYAYALWKVWHSSSVLPILSDRCFGATLTF
ncbi:hypothetical protein [Nostoc sp.]